MEFYNKDQNGKLAMSHKNGKGAKLIAKENGEEKWGEMDLCCQVPKQDRAPVGRERKIHTADQQLDSPADLFQYSELGAMHVPTTGRLAPETETQ